MATPGKDEGPASTPPRTSSVTGDGAQDVAAGTRTRSSTTSTGRLRRASLRFMESSPPSGMWHATGTVLAQAPNPMEIRRGDYSHNGWDGALQRMNSNTSFTALSKVSSVSAQTPGSLVRTLTSPLGAHAEEEHEGEPTAKVTNARSQAFDDSEDDPFSKFVGRGRISSQVYEPGVKIEPTPPGESVDDDDSLEDLDPKRPVKRQSALPKKFMDPTGEEEIPNFNNQTENGKAPDIGTTTVVETSTGSKIPQQNPDESGVYPNGYKFPPKHTWGEATLIGLKAFWKFTLTPLGFLIVIYGLNVVAWGGMLFLLLIGGGKEFMCFPPGSHGEKDCNNINSPRRIWIEIDSQILNALFCVTGLGLIPWRFRDLYFILRWRFQQHRDSLRKLAGIHRAWFRLDGSQELPPTGKAATLPDADSNPAIPLPLSKATDPPLTGNRAPATAVWKLDFVIWMYVWNTFLQIVLCGFMWALNRHNRPSWSTGTFIALACIVAGLGGLMAFFEGKKIKAVEGIPVEEEKRLEDVERAVERAEKGEGHTIFHRHHHHHNNKKHDVKKEGKLKKIET